MFYMQFLTYFFITHENINGSTAPHIFINTEMYVCTNCTVTVQDDSTSVSIYTHVRDIFHTVLYSGKVAMSAPDK
jgi:hypothetical protein